jgi:hypothetical protein
LERLRQQRSPALQIAVDNKDEIVEPFPPGKRHGSERFWLVHFSVAHESPHLARFEKKLGSAIFFSGQWRDELVDKGAMITGE